MGSKKENIGYAVCISRDFPFNIVLILVHLTSCRSLYPFSDAHFLQPNTLLDCVLSSARLCGHWVTPFGNCKKKKIYRDCNNYRQRRRYSGDSLVNKIILPLNIMRQLHEKWRHTFGWWSGIISRPVLRKVCNTSTKSLNFSTFDLTHQIPPQPTLHLIPLHRHPEHRNPSGRQVGR